MVLQCMEINQSQSFDTAGSVLIGSCFEYYATNDIGVVLSKLIKWVHLFATVLIVIFNNYEI